MPLLFKPIFTRLFVVLYALGMASSIITVPDTRGAHMYDNAPMELFADVYIVCALVCMVPRRIRLCKRKASRSGYTRKGKHDGGVPLRALVKGIIYFLAYTLYIIDTFCWVKFGACINPTMLLLVSETTGSETREFFQSYVTTDLLWSGVGIMLLILVLHMVVAVAWKRWRGTEHLTLSFLKGASWQRRLAWHVVGSLPALALIVWLASYGMDNKRMFIQTMQRETIGEVERDMAVQPHAVLYQPPMRVAFALRGNYLIARQLTQLRDTTDGVSVDSCIVRSPEIVLIIGESFNKRHAQLYGYDKPNMPRQKALERQRRLVTFTDVVSPWNLTSFFFKHLMTTYVVGDKGDWCDYPLFCQIFRTAGYQVNFFTNQFLPKAREAVYDFSGGFFINDDEMSRLQFDVRNDQLHVFDEDLIHDFDRMLPDSIRKYAEKPQLTIFHLMGQHVNYRSRCPNSKKKFKPEDYPNDTDLSKKRLRTLADYDNAVWYNDSVVGLIIDRFKQRDAVIIYLSDHGEEVFGPGARHFFGRMHNAEITRRLAEEEFRVPMWIYTSPQYERTHPDVVAAVRRARHLPYMTDAVSHLLMGLAGIHCEYYNPRYDILSDDYDATRPRIMKNTTDYDKLKE